VSGFCTWHALLYTVSLPQLERFYFQDFAINYWIQKGAPANKLNVGMATYGRTFTLQNTSNTAVGAAITGPGIAGPYTREAGTLGYNEV
jgi:chitinase